MSRLADLERRGVLAGMGLGALVSLTPRALAGGVRVRTDVAPVVTGSGYVAGYWRGGVDIWKGIPYAASTAGEGRFMPPRPREPWDGVRRALNYGPVCPVGPVPPVDLSANEWPFLLANGPFTAPSEDCLRINIWSPSERETGSLPVMVWLHADGFGGGSSQKYLASDGENLARSQGVVVVSLNHRVGPLGFLNLARDPSHHFAAAANVGMLDIVHALQWVRDNIAGFGGDPGNVTVFGQSGGGFKISTLLAMPGAQGLFHRAIVQSGARLALHEPAASSRLAEAVIESARVAGPGELQSVPVDDFLVAAQKASAALAPPGGARPDPLDWAPPPHWFEPTAQTQAIPHQPFSRAALKEARQVPVICGTVRDEASPSVNRPEMEDLSFDEAVSHLSADLKGAAAPALRAARSEFPGATPTDLLSIVSSYRFRLQAVIACDRMARAGWPVWNYVFDWSSPLFEGRARAYHTSDVAFVFANTDLLDRQTGGGAEARALASRMS